MIFFLGQAGEIVEELRSAFINSLPNVDWMDDTTREAAKEKVTKNGFCNNSIFFVLTVPENALLFKESPKLDYHKIFALHQQDAFIDAVLKCWKEVI